MAAGNELGSEIGPCASALGAGGGDTGLSNVCTPWSEIAVNARFCRPCDTEDMSKHSLLCRIAFWALP